ncbi:MAG: type II 3-dehydroquinate dehydratase [Actinomycetota bacterium]
MKRLLVLNGPRLDLLGSRQPEVYGTSTLADIESMIIEQCRTLDLEPIFVQSSSESVLIEAIERTAPDAIVINPAAFTHFSFTLAQALAAAGVPAVEVHLSNIFAREPYRRLSVISPVVNAVVCGLGVDGYAYAIASLARMLSEL